MEQTLEDVRQNLQQQVFWLVSYKNEEHVRPAIQNLENALHNLKRAIEKADKDKTQAIQ